MHSKRVSRVRGLDELRATSLACVADAFASHLEQRHLAWHIAETYLRAAAHYARWLDQRGARASGSTVLEFWSEHLLQCRCTGRHYRSRIEVRAALGHLVTVLRAAGWLQEQILPRTPVDDEVDRFDTYLTTVVGAESSTRARRRLDVGQFLTSVFGLGTIVSSKITSTDVHKFVSTRPSTYSPGTLGVIAVSLRSYFRYLQLEGRCPVGAQNAVPSAARWRLATLPLHLTDDEVRRFLASFDDRTERGRRDRGMALCMVVLGLRAVEVAALRLGDIDWRDGRLRVPATKTRRGREVPLPQSVGRALAAYVRHWRPRSASDRVFLRSSALKGFPLKVGGVRGAMRLAYARAGLPPEYKGAHRLRHYAESRIMPSRGGRIVARRAEAVDRVFFYAA